jgi:hypothetical protein
MRPPRLVLALGATLLVLAAAAPAPACDSAGPNTHVGIVTAVDGQAGTFALKDAESRMSLTFRASAEQLRELVVGDQVTVTYTEEGQALRARTIRKS